MNRYLFLQFFFFLLADCLLHNVKPVKLKIDSSKYIRLKCGNPTKDLIFRLDFNLDENLIHDKSTLFYSSTLFIGNDDEFISDICYIGDYKIRLPLVYKSRHYESYDEIITDNIHHGTLGLSRFSKLIEIWRNFTISKDSLYLGKYAYFESLSNDKILTFDSKYLNNFYENSINDENLDQNISQISNIVPMKVIVNDIYETFLFFDFSLSYSRFPLELLETKIDHIEISLHNINSDSISINSEKCKKFYFEFSEFIQNELDKKKIIEHCNKKSLKLDFLQQKITLANGLEYNALAKSKDQNIYLGSRFLQDYVIFVDYYDQLFLIEPSIFNNNNTSFLLYISYMLIILICIWASLLAVVLKTDLTSSILILIVALEGYMLIICLVLNIIFFIGIDITSIISNFVQYNSLILLIFITIFNLLTIVSYFYIFSNIFRFYFIDHKDKTIIDEDEILVNTNQLIMDDFHKFSHLNVYFFTSNIFFFIWLSLIEKHQNVNDLMYMLIIATIQSILITIITTISTFQRSEFYQITLILLPIFFIFFLFYNVIPAIYTAPVSFISILYSIFFVLIVILLPSFYIATKFLSDKILEKQNKLKKIE